MAPKRSLPPRPVPVKKESVKKIEKVIEEEIEQEEIVKPRRHKVTIEEHIAHYDKVMAFVEKEIDKRSREKEKGVRSLRTIRNHLKQMKKEFPQVARSKKARQLCSTRINTNSGLMMKYSITPELAAFLKVEENTTLSRIEATRAICAYSHLKIDENRPEVLRWQHLNPKGKRNLQNKDDKMSIIPDSALSKLLRYEKYKKQVKKGEITKKVKSKETGEIETVVHDSDTLYYWVIQKLINIHFVSAQPKSEI
jgi:chromatin remodeling complex protein RSC6